MLTLQNILGSDSFASAIQKINENFKSIGLGGGGPQGIRGEQGIPGLPGKRGSTGPIGPAGNNGLSVDIMPWMPEAGPGNPLAGPLFAQYPQSSLDWLIANYGDTGAPNGMTPTPGMVLIDHQNFGYWQYLDGVLPNPGPTGPIPSPLLPGGPDSSDAIWNGLYIGPDYTGPGWYYYPSDIANIIATLGDVWENDYTTYLTGPTDYNNPANVNIFNQPFVVPKARLKSKFGVIWISSHDTAPGVLPPSDETNNQSATIKDVNLNGYSERSAGVDRLLFKFSLDGRTLAENMYAQGYSAVPPGEEMTNGPFAPQNFINSNSYIKPIYGKSLAEFSPLVYLSPWSSNDEQEDGGTSKEGNYGIFAYQSTPFEEGADSPVQLWVMSHRKQDIPNNLIDDYPTSRNLGEHLLDTRRTITANQYAVLPSQDTAPIDETTNLDEVSGNITFVNESGPYVYQGYHALINGSYVNNNYYKRSYLLNMTDLIPMDETPWVRDSDDINHNILRFSNINVYKRAAWFGSSVHSFRPSDFDGSESKINEYIRSAGMMERDRVYETFTRGFRENPGTNYAERADELLFYTAHTPADIDASLTDRMYDEDGIINNALRSKVVLFLSSSRNVGITTTPRNDLGIVEPLARFQTHARKGIANERYVFSSVIDASPIFGMTSSNANVAAFTSEKFPIEQQFDRTIGTYTTVKIGRAETPDEQLENIYTDYKSLPQGGMRFETYGVGVGNDLGNTGSLQFGIGLGGTNPMYEIERYNNNFLTEWVLGVSPVATGQQSSSDDHSDRASYIAGVGIQERFPKTRFHMYGQNKYRVLNSDSKNDPEGLYGRDESHNGNTTASRQIVLDYLESKWVTGAGLLDYRYPSALYPANLNSVNYPYIEGYIPKGLYDANPVPTFDIWQSFTGPMTSNDGWYNASGVWFPGGAIPANGVGTSTHGGQFNGYFPVDRYQGFNLLRDLSYTGDDRDLTTWSTGTNGVDNGATAILSDSFGQIGIAMIPRWRDGGVAAGNYEQRNLGGRDISNAMKIFFDAFGNMGIGGKVGWDPDAYPSRFKDENNRVLYLNTDPVFPYSLVTYGVPSSRVVGPDNGGYFTGKTAYPAPYTGQFDAGAINAMSTYGEAIRFEVAAEKLFQAPGRVLQNRGWGYPANRNTPGTYFPLQFTAANSNGEYTGTCLAATDSEGRILSLFFDFATIGQVYTLLNSGPFSAATADRFLLQHPTEITGVPGYAAPISATAPAFNFVTFNPLGNSVDIQWTTQGLYPAVMRLNNFVTGEGEGQVGSIDLESPGDEGGWGNTTQVTDTTSAQTQALRRESPKLIMSFEGLDEKTSRGRIVKVNTVIHSAQNESTLRDYWIPKTDNTGGTFMAFTSHFEKVANDDSIDRTSIKRERLQIEEVTYVAIDYYKGGALTTSGQVINGFRSGNNLNRSMTGGSGYDTLGATSFPTPGIDTNPPAFLLATRYTVQVTGTYSFNFNSTVQLSMNKFSGGQTTVGVAPIIYKLIKNGNVGSPLATWGDLSVFGGYAWLAFGNDNGSWLINPTLAYTGAAVASDYFEIHIDMIKRSSMGLSTGTGTFIADSGSFSAVGQTSGSVIGLFHPTYIKYDYNFTNYGINYVMPLFNSATPDVINWPQTPPYNWSNPYGKYYDGSGVGLDREVLLPLRRRRALSTLPTADAFGYNYAVEILKTDNIDPADPNIERKRPTQIRFRRINSEFAMMDFNITLQVNDAFDLALLDIEDPGVTGPPNNTGNNAESFAEQVTRRGLWWLQQARIRFDIDSGMIVATTLVGPTSTPDYHLNEYDKGMGFRMWSDYNQWYQGTAVAHRGVDNAIGYGLPARGDSRWNKTFNHNTWNWPVMMGDYLNANSRVEPKVETDCSFTINATSRWLNDLVLGTTSVGPQFNLPAKSYDRDVYVTCTGNGSGENWDVQCYVENGFNNGTYKLLQRTQFGDGRLDVGSLTFTVPAGCKFAITGADVGGPNSVVRVFTYHVGSTFNLDYHGNVRNTGITWGLSSTTGVLLPFVQALRNRLLYDGTWTEIYQETDGYFGPTSPNLINLMRQVWTTFGNGAFQKSKALQWRVTPYNDPGTRGAGYESTITAGQPELKSLPRDRVLPGNDQQNLENSFYLEFVIPDGILHDPSAGWGEYTGVSQNKNTPALVISGFANTRDYRFVTLSGQAMVNFQKIAVASADLEFQP